MTDRTAEYHSNEDLIAGLRSAAGELAAAARGVRDAGHLDLVETLQEVLANTQRMSTQILYVALTGELPADTEEPAPAGDERTVLREIERTIDSLCAHLAEATDEFDSATWRHPAEGELSWRGWTVALADYLNQQSAEMEETDRA